jgi:hypothetical protein
MKLLMVKWIDATMEGGWHDNEYAETLDEFEPNVVSVGFLVSKNEHFLKLSQSDGSSQKGNLLTIPVAWAVDIQEIGSFEGQVDGAV